MTTNRRGKSRPGNSYKDPVYDAIEARLEQKYGLPAGGMAAIRTKGERSNADQVSSAGARTVYQIIPATRALFQKRYGIDAYSSPEAAAEVAALHLRDSMKRNGGRWEDAVGEYHGGTDRSEWGQENRKYRKRVTGKDVVERVGTRGATALKSGVSIADMDLWNTSPSDFGTGRGIGPKPPGESRETKRKKDAAALIGGQPVAPKPLSTDADLSAERAVSAAQTAEQTWKDKQTFGDRVRATIQQDWFLPSLLRSLEEADKPADPAFQKHYRDNWRDIEDFAETPRERAQLREAQNWDELLGIQQKIQGERLREKIINSNDTGLAFHIGVGGLGDPAGWLAGMGAGKLVQGFGLGTKLIGAAIDGAAGNIAMTAALDAAGQYKDATDYTIDAVTGVAIGSALHLGKGIPGRVNSARVDAEAKKIVDGLSADQAVQAASVSAEVEARVGRDATPEQIARETEKVIGERAKGDIETSLAEVDASHRFLPADPDELLTRTAASRGATETAHGLDAIADDLERTMVAETAARADAFVAANPMKDVGTVLERVGQESTGMRLMKSESNVAKMVAAVLLEGTTGAAGRRRTAAMSRAVRERLYMRAMIEYDGLAAKFRQSEGGSAVRDFLDGQYRREFNRRVYAEVEARGHKPEGWTGDTHPAVVRAADIWEHGMNMMRVEQQHVGTVGSARLGSSSRGYMTHRLDPRAVVRLMDQNPAQAKKVRAILEDQFKEFNEYVVAKDGEAVTKKYDADFAKKLAKRYLEVAYDRAKGSYEVPFNLHSPEAADIVRDSLQALNMKPDEIDEIMGKFSRGGASHTKKRLRLDLSADIGEGMTLQDLFVQDIPQLYRSYARRVSGEVALAQYGVMGKKGLNVLRKAIQQTGGSEHDLKSFDQIAAEFLNTPFGSHNHRYMDNLRIGTSAARLGGMGFTQFAEYGNAMAAIGVARTFSAIKSMPRLLKEVGMLKSGGEAKNPILQSIDQLGGHIGLDEYQLTRMFDVKDNDINLYSEETVGVFTRALRGASHFQAIASGHRAIIAVQTRGMAEQIVRKAVQFVKKGGDDAALDDMGINAQMRAKLAANLDKIATFDSKGNLLELDLLKGDLDGATLMEFRDAIERGAGQIIQRTYIGETGKWAHDGLLKMLFQFRTFSLTSIEKQWGRNVNNHGAVKSFAYLMGAMSFAMPIHAARVHAKTIGMSRKEREDYVDKQLSPIALGRATLNYASAAGLSGDILDLGGGFASSFGVIDDDLGIGPRGAGRGDLIGGVVAPGVGLADDLWAGVHGNWKKLAKALPGANLPMVAPLITGLASE